MGVEYNSDKLKLKTLMNRDLLFDTTWSYLACSHFALGGQFNINLNTTNLSKYDFGLNWALSQSASLGVKHESTNQKALEFGRFSLFVNHAANANQTVGTEFGLNWATKAVEARLGLNHRFNEETSGKFKVNQDGQLDATLKHRINSSVTASLVTGASLRNIVAAQKHKFLPLGIALDLKL
jgi:hypothetical protein